MRHPVVVKREVTEASSSLDESSGKTRTNEDIKQPNRSTILTIVSMHVL